MEDGHLTENEDVQWLSCPEHCRLSAEQVRSSSSSWIVEGPQYTERDVEEKSSFCDLNLLRQIFRAKTDLDKFDLKMLREVRSQVNPYESLHSAFFMNRAALKMANIDAATNFMFTDPDDREAPVDDDQNSTGARYFADVCAGPGGFSEYVLWRRGWRCKGFGFTLCNSKNDFRLTSSRCAPHLVFGSYTGVRNDGNIYFLENIEDFGEHVRNETVDGLGVHFMMSDGGFSVQGRENLQEVLSKRIYVCQCLTALKIVRPGGHFVTKMFDLYTPFSAQLIFFMYNCFEKIAIFKPLTSRPANSERYLICSGLREDSCTAAVREHLEAVTRRFGEISIDDMTVQAETDINDILPLKIVSRDNMFTAHLREQNDQFGQMQLLSLQNLNAVAAASDCLTTDNNATYSPEEAERLRASCLERWKIPTLIPYNNTNYALLRNRSKQKDYSIAPLKVLSEINDLYSLFGDFNDWRCAPSSCKDSLIKADVNIYTAEHANGKTETSSINVHRHVGDCWGPVKKLPLIPGTVLYGEMVFETATRQGATKGVSRRTLQVVDANCLGDVFVGNMPYRERRRHIEIYCDALNRETRSCKWARLRVKPSHSLADFCGTSTRNWLRNEKTSTTEQSFLCELRKLGWKTSVTETMKVSSVLFYKTSSNFDESFESRFLVNLKTGAKDTGFDLEELIQHVKATKSCVFSSRT